MQAQNTVFPYANTIICIEDSKLLKQFQYDILYNTHDLQASLDELNKMNYFRTYENADAGNYGDILEGLMKDTFELMKSVAPKEALWRMFALYYDIHNMKLVVKERFFGKRLGDLRIAYGSYSLRTIRSAAVRESDNILDNEALTTGFFEALQAKEMYEIDFILDKTYFKTLKNLTLELGIPEIVEFVTEKTDLFNVSVLFQSRAAGSPAGYFAKAFSDQGSYTLGEWQSYIDRGPGEVEKFPIWQKYRPIWRASESRQRLFEELDVLIDNYLIERTKACKLIAFGITPICAYFFNKFIEIKNIRILLTGKENNYRVDEIRRRMRIPYEL